MRWTWYPWRRSSNSSMTLGWRSPTAYAQGLTTNPSSAKGLSRVHAPPMRPRASSTRTWRPARAREAAAGRPLWPAPITMASHRVAVRLSRSATQLGDEQDLSHQLAGFHEAMGLRRRFEGQDPVDHRSELAAAERRDHVGGERGDYGSLLGGGAGSQCCGDQGHSASHHDAEVDVGVGAVS